MRKLVLFATILALATFASAQQLVIDFDTLPQTNTPAAVPENYGGLDWQGIDTVDSQLYADAGAGFFTGNHVMLAFIGGPLCWPNYGGTNNDGTAARSVCEGAIHAGVGPTALSSFQADSAVVSAGWTDASIVVVAYSNGNEVGRRRYNLTNQVSNIVFPSSWGQITELTIHPTPLGSAVIYTLTIN